MKFLTYIAVVVALAGCSTTKNHDTVVIAGSVKGCITGFSADGLCGSVPFVVVFSAGVRIAEPESLRNLKLTVWASEDFPFREGDLVEFDFSHGGLYRSESGELNTSLVPKRQEPNKALVPTTTAVTPAADAPVAPAAVAAHL